MIKLETMIKEEVIIKIKEIVEEYGSFTMGQVDANYNPSIETFGNLIHSIWQCNLNTVDVEVLECGGNIEVDNYELSYENLDLPTLNYIHELACR